MAEFDRWALLRIVEVLLVIACLIFKRVTDDEARSLSLYLQKLSREWSLLTNVTWDRIGSAVADATYGGYLIITAALLIGKIFGELPTKRRIMEWVFLGVGAILFIALGSLSFASIDSVPHDLVDNAAILGTLSVVTGALFLLDMGGPKAKKEQPPAQSMKNGQSPQQPDVAGQTNNAADRTGRSVTEQVLDIEREVEMSERATYEPSRIVDPDKGKSKKDTKNNGIKNGTAGKIETILKETPILPGRSYIHLDPTSKGYKQMRDDDFDIPRRFGIYGKDVTDYGTDTDETASIPPKIELHTPVWGNIRKETVKKYNIPPVILPQRILHEDDPPARLPSGPLDPGYVQYTAQHWGESKKNGTKTPRHSPTEV